MSLAELQQMNGQPELVGRFVAGDLQAGITWWTLIRDLRTSLKKHPLDLALMKELLGEAA